MHQYGCRMLFSIRCRRVPLPSVEILEGGVRVPLDGAQAGVAGQVDGFPICRFGGGILS